MPIPAIPPSAPGARFIRDSNGNILGIAGQQGGTIPLVRGNFPRRMTGVASLGLPPNGGVGAGTNWQIAMCAARAYNAIEVMYATVGTTLGTMDATAVAGHNTAAQPIVAPSGAWTVGAAVSIPLEGTATNPAIASTGPISSPSVPRIDGGAYPIAVIRSRSVAALPGYTQWTNMSANWDANNPNWTMYACSSTSTADLTSVNQASFASAGRTSIIVPAAVKFHYNTPGITGIGIGDSIMGGDSVLAAGTVQRNSYGFQTIRALQDLGLPFDFINTGISGNAWAQSSPRGKAYIDIVRPDFALIECYTPNDAIATQADVESQWRNAMNLVEYVENAGVIPIIIGPTPDNNYNTTVDNLRLQLRARGLASGRWFLDVEPLVSDGASPARWKNGYNDNGNHTHPGPVGNAAIALGDAGYPGLKQLLLKIFY